MCLKVTEVLLVHLSADVPRSLFGVRIAFEEGSVSLAFQFRHPRSFDGALEHFIEWNSSEESMGHDGLSILINEHPHSLIGK